MYKKTTIAKMKTCWRNRASVQKTHTTVATLLCILMMHIPLLAQATKLESLKPAQDTPSLTAPFVPSGNKILLFIGQDSDTIAEYQKAIPEDTLEGVTLYTSIKHEDPNHTLPAMHSVANWQSGNMDFTKTLANSPSAALAIGLAFDNCNSQRHEEMIANGQYDKSIEQLAEYLKTLAPRPIFLRIGYEFDGPWNCYTPHFYKQAFRHIMNIIKQHKAHNVVSDWQSATWPDASIAGENTQLYDHGRSEHLSTWYPGSDVVDWIGLSVFYRDLSQWNYKPEITPHFAQQKLLNFARQHHKPVMIAEAAPQGYDNTNLTQSPIQTNNKRATTAKAIWQNWYQPFFDFVYANSDVIRAVAYINTHWASQPMWLCEPNAKAGQKQCPNGYWGDTRVQANSHIKQRWLNEISNSDIWVQQQINETAP